MKKNLIVTLTIMFSLACFNLNAKKITILRKGSDDGVHYNRIAESHGWFQSSLSCLDPGETNCGWTNPPSVGGLGTVEIEDWVMSEIASGRTEGKGIYKSSVFVEWTYDSETGDLRIEMNDEF